MACLAMPSACWSAGVDLQPPRVRLVLPMKPAGNETNLFFSVYSRCMRPNPRKGEMSSTSARRKGILLLIERGEGRVLGPDEGGYERARASQLRTWSLREPPPLDRKCIFAGRVSLSPG